MKTQNQTLTSAYSMFWRGWLPHASKLVAAAVIACSAANTRAADAFQPGLPFDGSDSRSLAGSTYKPLPARFRNPHGGLGIQPPLERIVESQGLHRLGGHSLTLLLGSAAYPTIYVADLPLGCARPNGDDAAFRDVDMIESDWTTQTWAANGEAIKYTLSRLSPAVLIDCMGDSLGLFKNWNVNYCMYNQRLAFYWLLAFGRRLKQMYNIPSGPHASPTEVMSWTYTPRFASMAYAGHDKIEVMGVGDSTGANTVSADFLTGEMAENWILLWFSEYTPLGHGQKVVESEDIPMLVVFEKRPDEIAFGHDGLDIARKDGVGKLAMMPLLGMNRPSVERMTALWTRDMTIPDEVAEKCRFWARRLAHYPVSVTETFRIDEETGDMIVRNEFGYIDMELEYDELQDKSVRCAPYPPMLGISKDAFGLDCADPLFFDVPGRYVMKENADSIEYRLKNPGKYVFEQPVFSPDALPDYLKTRLEEEVGKTVQAGHLAPLHLGNTWCPSQAGTTVARYIPITYRAPFSNPANILYSLSMSLDFIPEPLRAQAIEYMKKELAAYPPLDTPFLPFLEGTRRERNPDIGQYHVEHVIKPELEKIAKELAALPHASHARFCETLYYLAVYSARTGDKTYVADNWDKINAMFRAMTANSDWARMLLFHQPLGSLSSHDNIAAAGGVSTCNLLIAGGIGYARIACMLDRPDDERWGVYNTARWLAARKGLAGYVKAMYEAGLPISPDFAYYAKYGPQTNQALKSMPGGVITEALFKDKDFLALREEAKSNAVPETLYPGDMATAWQSDTRQVMWFDEFEVLFARSSYLSHNAAGVAYGVYGLTPEAARFLADECGLEMSLYAGAFEYGNPMWFAAWAPRQGNGEITNEHPNMKRDMFALDAFALDRPAEDMMNRLDIPFCLGDPDYMRNIAFISWATAGRQWAAWR